MQKISLLLLLLISISCGQEGLHGQISISESLVYKNTTYNTRYLYHHPGHISGKSFLYTYQNDLLLALKNKPIVEHHSTSYLLYQSFGDFERLNNSGAKLFHSSNAEYTQQQDYSEFVII